MISRYSSAYSTARLIIVIGRIVVVLGILIGFLSMTVGFSLKESSTSLFLIYGLVSILASVVMGIVISAQGQMMLAVLDTAINTSPFMNLKDKAQAMRIPSSALPAQANLTASPSQ
jgi:hypothetical protein